MKNVLLTTTALVAFAGAAVAVEVETTYSGEAEFGYQFTAEAVTEDYLATNGIYATASIEFGLTLSQELNNGAVASLTFGSVGWDSVTGIDSTPTYVAKLDTSYGSLSYGHITNVNEELFAEVTGMVFDDESFGAIDHGVSGTGIRAESTLGGYAIAASTDRTDVAVNASGSAGSVDFALFYETSIMGLNASTSVAGMDLTFAYADDGTTTSFGVGVGYAVTSTISASGSYASNAGVAAIAVGVAYDGGSITAAADYDVTNSELDLEAGYSMEVMSGMTVSVNVEIADATGTSTVTYNADVAYIMGDLAMYAGIDNASNLYAGVNYDLGGGASAYAYTADLLESGPLEWADGARAGVAFTF